MTVEAVTPIAFTVPDAVAYSSFSRSRLYKLMQSGALESFRIGGRRMIRRDALDRFFDRLTQAEAA